MEQKLTALIEESKAKLEKLAGMTSAEAKKILMENMLQEARHEAAKKIKTD